MRQRGKKSVAALSVVAPASAQIERPPAPAHLSAAEAAEWTKIVEAMPSGWFASPDVVLLELMVVHIVLAREVVRRIHEAIENQMDSKPFGKLLAMEVGQSKQVADLATKMRLTKHSRSQAITAARAIDAMPKGKMPWEYP